MSEPKHPEIEVTINRNSSQGNTVQVIGEVRQALKAAGFRAEAEEVGEKLFLCHSPEEAFELAEQYVTMLYKDSKKYTFNYHTVDSGYDEDSDYDEDEGDY